MFKEKTGIKGIVRMKLFDKEGNQKPLFQSNRIWEILKKLFKVDLAINGITGKYVLEEVVYNTITTAGLAITAKRLGQVSATGITHMAIGEGSGGTTALDDEIDSGGGARVGVTPTSETTTSAGDTVRSVKLFEFTDSFAVTEEGLFNHSSAGDMIAYKEFPAVNVGDGDSLQITHDIVVSEAAGEEE